MFNNEKVVNPIPQGKYLPASRFGNIVYSAGMTPRHEGILIQSGKVKIEEPVSSYKAAVEQATSNALNAIFKAFSTGERISQILSLHVYINTQENFEAHSSLADFASEYLFDKLGECAIGSRAAIGVASLPGNAPVEIQIVAGIMDS